MQVAEQRAPLASESKVLRIFDPVFVRACALSGCSKQCMPPPCCVLQAISLGMFPRLTITFTDKLVEGQIYIGPVRQTHKGTQGLPACLSACLCIHIP